MNVGQVGNLPPIVNRRAEAFDKLPTGRLAIGRSLYQPAPQNYHVLD